MHVGISVRSLPRRDHRSFSHPLASTLHTLTSNIINILPHHPSRQQPAQRRRTTIAGGDSPNFSAVLPTDWLWVSFELPLHSAAGTHMQTTHSYQKQCQPAVESPPHIAITPRNENMKNEQNSLLFSVARNRIGSPQYTVALSSLAWFGWIFPSRFRWRKIFDLQPPFQIDQSECIVVTEIIGSIVRGATPFARSEEPWK